MSPDRGIPGPTSNPPEHTALAGVPLNSVLFSDVPNRPLDLISQRSAGLPGSSSASYHRSITGGLLSGHIDVPGMPYWTHSTFWSAAKQEEMKARGAEEDQGYRGN